MDSSNEEVARPARWFRAVRLRDALLAVLLLAVLVGPNLYRYQRRQSAIAVLEERFATPIYQDELIDQEGNHNRSASYRTIVNRSKAGGRTPPPAPPGLISTPPLAEPFRAMTELDAVGSQIRDEDIAFLPDRFPELEFVYLGRTSITDEGLKSLGRLKRLRVLHLYQSKVTDQGLASLSGLSTLEELTLSFNLAITDAGIKHLTGLSKLGMLELKDTNVTDQCIDDIKKLKSLRFIMLSGCQITDRGLAALSDMPQLKAINLSQTEVTMEGVDALKARFPGLKVW